MTYTLEEYLELVPYKPCGNCQTDCKCPSVQIDPDYYIKLSNAVEGYAAEFTSE